jgi:hypothetical protein
MFLLESAWSLPLAGIVIGSVIGFARAAIIFAPCRRWNATGTPATVPACAHGYWPPPWR